MMLFCRVNYIVRTNGDIYEDSSLQIGVYTGFNLQKLIYLSIFCVCIDILEEAQYVESILWIVSRTDMRILGVGIPHQVGSVNVPYTTSKSSTYYYRVF